MIRATVKIKRVISKVSNKCSGWVTCNVETFLEKSVIHPTSSNILIIVRDDGKWVPIEGDVVSLYKKPSNEGWFVEKTPFNGHPDPYIYERKIEGKEIFDVNGESINLYRIPDFSKVLWFEIKPVVCYYNELTRFQHCEAITTSTFDLTNAPDQLIWSIYERQPGGVVHRIVTGKQQNL